jgi:hypothetical protein
VELVHMVLVPATPDLSSDVAGWVATRPCAVWQLRAFLRLAGVVGAGRVPHGYLDARRFAAVDGHHAVTDVFHDEAIAYAHWFGKSITGRFTLQAASALLSPDELDALMPPGTALWDAAEYLEGEREAVTWANLFADDEDDEDGDDRAGPLTERREIGEWERHPHIAPPAQRTARDADAAQLPRRSRRRRAALSRRAAGSPTLRSRAARPTSTVRACPSSRGRGAPSWTTPGTTPPRTTRSRSWCG